MQSAAGLLRDIVRPQQAPGTQEHIALTLHHHKDVSGQQSTPGLSSLTAMSYSGFIVVQLRSESDLIKTLPPRKQNWSISPVPQGDFCCLIKGEISDSTAEPPEWSVGPELCKRGQNTHNCFHGGFINHPQQHAIYTRGCDNDQYSSNCATSFKGAWWCKECQWSNLNGLYLRGAHESCADGVNWKTGKGQQYSYKMSEMKFRPV
ncbi:unnamed protein product [Lepidochelys kempii]